MARNAAYLARPKGMLGLSGFTVIDCSSGRVGLES